MKIFECDHHKYVKLGDLDHLLRVLRGNIFEKYDRKDGKFYQKDGTEGITHDDGMKLAAFGLVMGKILENPINACETQEEVFEYQDRVESEFYHDKYVVTVESKDANGKKILLFFDKFCTDRLEKELREQGKTEEEIEEALLEESGDPVFVDYSLYANYFENYDFADSTAQFLKKRCKLKAKAEPAWYFDRNAAKRLKKMLSEVDEEEKKSETK